MVSEDYSAQLKWFAKKLIEIRISLETDGFNEPIDFDLALITKPSILDFGTASRTPLVIAERMLNEIRGELISEKGVHPTELKWRDLENGHIKIDGFTTALLRKYLKEVFDETFHLFGEARDEGGRTVLAYNGRPTSVPISGNQLAVFRCLLRNFGEAVTFEELHEAIRSQSNIVHGPALSRPATDDEKEVVCTAVNALKQKIKEVSGSRYQKIIESARGKGYAMII